MSVTVATFTTPRFMQNGYVLSADGQALIVDPGGEMPALIDYLQTRDLRPLAVLATHGHFDHVAAVQECKDAFQIPFYLHSHDARLLRHANLYRKMLGETEFIAIPTIDVSFDDLPQLRLGSFVLDVLHTPGHTPGSVCFLCGEMLFTGDTLQSGSVGRTDLPGGDASALSCSLQRLRRLAVQTTIYPGHGAVTTMGAECLHNPLLQEAIS